MKSFFFIILFVLTITTAKSNIQNTIVVKVNNKIITSFEVKNKILSTLIISGNEINQDNIDKLKGQTLESLINFKLKEIELEKYDFKVDEKRLDNYINRVTRNNIVKVKNNFSKYNLDYNLWINELETQFKWQNFIYSFYSKKIDTNENFISDEIDKIVSSQMKIKEVNLSEIEIMRNDNSSNDEIINKTLNEIKNNGFENTALKFSISNTSSQKGNMGWINSKIISKEVNDVIVNLSPGSISKPVIRENSIIFFKLNSERYIENKDIDKEILKKNIIQRKKNELFEMYSKSHLSILKNNSLVQYQ